MARKVKEWVGKSDDSRPPPRVLRRIFEREGGVCHISGRKIAPGERWQADHKIAIINGGENKESNLFPALIEPHKEKTRRDLDEKKRIAALVISNIGARQPTKRPIPQGPSSLTTKPKREPKPALTPKRLFEDV